MPVLRTEQAKAYYDWFGAKQDSQAFYERSALELLVAHGAFDSAAAVFEFGCGTGRFALDLLQHHLPGTASYRGTDISTTMVEIARGRLAVFGERANVSLSAGAVVIPLEDHCVDRVVSTYVLDLLPPEATREFLDEARRVLRADGLLCLVGITRGTTLLSRAVMGAWQWLFDRKPSWVGGCRPTQLKTQIPVSGWTIRFHEVVVAWGIASEVVVAAPARN